MRIISPKRSNKKRSIFSFNRWFKARDSQSQPDYLLMGIIILIVLFGLVMLFSASNAESFKKFNDAYYLWRHQLLYGFLPGLVLFFIFYRLDHRSLQKHTVVFFTLAIILLVLVFLPGVGTNYGSASSWINLGGVSLQPSEIVKLLLILSLAGWFAERGKEMTSDLYNGLIPFTVILGLICVPIILQPDIGTLSVVVAIALTIYYVAGAKLAHLVGLIIAGLGALAILIAQAPYRAARLMTFLHPELDPQGIGYHINQAFLAIGSGGWWGLGYGNSRQKFAYLPEVMGDSIFAIIAEELGFIFASLLVILFIILMLRGLKLAQNTGNVYARYVVVGIIAWISFQAFFNIAAMVGLVPLTGIPLPFISYGGTALMSLMAASGILLNISRHEKY